MASEQELEAELKLRGDKITELDARLTAARQEALDNRALSDQLAKDLAQAQASLLAVNADRAALTSQVTTLSQRVARLVTLHERAGQVLSSIGKAAHDEINSRNGIELATGDKLAE